ncbi:asparagine synthase (glutamine-hydrolyzing) [Thalassospira tepidiphila]|jgi:asparagine synthase (glutamine-hydrolysing)|uniref:asparagine synthase (glutamine-hydrolyzing) n=1 Tax=Thalassospira tepidiphila TaxID=393657 RepID=UPI001BCFD5F0|nr:asparagine synthase (glutamine-hydrolyzing) [Thalassospira tepidiphila]MBS8273442.1 asparagine synthase (glutamine-hydrolyzing) [Thalassospira tepidiphila]
MCGLTGYLNLNGSPASARIVQAMAQNIAHRGPDDDGVYTSGAIALAHRRLSIIDLSSAGHQPMMSPCNRFTIVYNGEIYNFQELRAELQSKGLSFVSQSDTEVLLRGFEYWGDKVVEKLNGMFAFAVWDSLSQCLFLARDRYGVKPLYLGVAGKTLLFGSEVKSFFPHPSFHVGLDENGLREYFTFQNLFSERTLFQNVSLLPPGHFIWVDLNSSNDKIRKPVQYWDYHFENPQKVHSRGEYLEELDRLFIQAVSRQLVSDVDIGSYLSGGMDSGSITAIASREIANLRTFTIGFDKHSSSGMEVALDEREMAEFMSYKLGTEHYEMVLKAGDMERCMKDLVWHLEEPRVGQSYPNFHAAKLAGKFGKVVLSGTGGDELFGGYPWRYYRAVVNDDFEHYVGKYFNYWKRLVPDEAATDFFAPMNRQETTLDPKEIFEKVFKSHADTLNTPQDYVNHSLYFEAKTFLNGLLVVEDKLSMAHGLETRVPFLDNDLVDFAMTLPVEMKLGNLQDVVSLNENEPGRKTSMYFQKTRDGKLLLREAMERYIPSDITQNIKQGFSAPDASWYKGESIDYVRKKLLDPNAGIYEFLDRKTVQRLVEDHLGGRANRRLLIWSLLYFEEWIDVFLRNGMSDQSIRFSQKYV